MTMGELLDQIRALFDSKINKLEIDLKQSINEVRERLEDLNVKHSESSERLTAVETKVDMCENARIDQGRRVGELERLVMRIETRIETREETKKQEGDKTAGWVRWAPTLVFGALGAAGVIVALTK